MLCPKCEKETAMIDLKYGCCMTCISKLKKKEKKEIEIMVMTNGF